jgi:hypothetical protein
MLSSMPVEIRQCFSACAPGFSRGFQPCFTPTFAPGFSHGLTCLGIFGHSSKVEFD